MQNNDLTLSTDNIELGCFSSCEDESESLVIFELAVPVAAKVPALQQYLEVAKLVVRQASVTSTVPGEVLTQLRVNNTAVGGGWCVSATLAAPLPPRRLSMCS